MTEKDIKRFWSKVDIRSGDECWEWKAFRNKYGYGLFNHLPAHRMAYRLGVGSIPDGLCVLHKCDNPPCCNPLHLFLGTRADNNRDKKEKGRAPSQKGEQNGNAKLTEAEILLICRVYAIRNFTMRELAIKYKVSEQHIFNIIKHKSWKHANK